MSEWNLDFSGKVVLVTGGGTGIGQATAIAFARQGAKVVIAGRSNADETLRCINEAGGEAIFVRTDVGVAADVQRLIQTTVDTYGRLDICFNNAGVGQTMLDLVDHTEADFDRIIGIDLRGVFLCMKYEIPEMLKVGGGAIINCGSVASLIADPGMSVYVAAKHGIAGLTKGAALDYAKRNIRINAICPGFTDTPLTKDCPADMREIIKSFNAVNRISDPNEIAGIVLFLASDMASFITGAVIPVDGGQTAH